MSTTATVPREADLQQLQQDRIINDLSIQVATVNGSGSQTANMVLLRAIFQMGVPVSGKNLFPSNIAGLPTWYTIRANKHGYVARKKEIDFLVAMNQETAREDVQGLAPGAAVVYDEPLNLNQLRDDLVFYPVPFGKLVATCCPDAKLRRLVRNMIYDGVVARLLGIDIDQVEKALRKQFKKKAKAAELNWNAAKVGHSYAEQNLPKRDPYWVESMNAARGKIIIDGNSAAALGCMFAGVTVATWYPITPSSSLCEALGQYMERYRTDPETGKATFAIVQAEDELAAIGMVLGASWAGARSMTSTSGPGISLMSEFVGLGYYVELPAVIFDIQRVGPSTGLPTRTMQGDILSTAFLSHGDTKHVMLFPCSVDEVFAMAQEAFNLADELQTPVFIMSDLDLGMNNWMSDPFPYPAKSLRRGKVLSVEDLDRVKQWGRYKDVDGDAIRTAHCLVRVIPAPPGLLEAAATTRMPSTPSAPLTIRTTWTGWPASSKPRARWCQLRRRTSMVRRWASSPLAPPTGPSSKHATSFALSMAWKPITCACGATRLPTQSRSSFTATGAFTWWNRTATARCTTCFGLTWPWATWRGCAAFATTTASRWMPAA